MADDLILFSKDSDYFNALKISHPKTIKIYEYKDLKNSKKDNINIIQGNLVHNREILENKNVAILVSPEKGIKKDYFHFRNSGLNHILCKIAKQNNTIIAFNFNEVLCSKEKFLLLGKMIQNVKLCRKFKVKMILASFANNEFELRSKDAIKSFGFCIGMTPSEIKKSFEYLSNIK